MKSIALVGNPNSGKSTLFNALTGAKQFIGNWPGVTVEKKEGKCSLGSETVQVMDLPGIYSLSPYSNEEIVSRDYIMNEHPDVVVNIIDSTNLERNLYLTTQVLELGVPMVVALNMTDVIKKKGEVLNVKELSKQLGCPCVEISAVNKTGIDDLKAVITKLMNGKAESPKHQFAYAADVEAAVSEVKELCVAKGAISTATPEADFVALKVILNDEGIIEEKKVSADVVAKATGLREGIEKSYEDDIDSIIAEQRYAWINGIIDRVITTRAKETVSLSDKIDRVMTNKWLALPLFLLIIYGIYFVCLNPSGLGKYLVGVTFTWVINAMIWTSMTLTDLGVTPWLVSLISDGCMFGIGIVLAFIPYLCILFVFLAILEECGYMARVAFIFDRIFRRFGLSGKSFIPMLLGTGCSVQAIASCRTIEDEADRRMTIFLTPFMPCATKMPVILLVVGVFTNSAVIAPFCYIIAIFMIIIGGIFLKKTFLKSEPAPFVMELPEYRMPRVKNVLRYVLDKAITFFRKVATIVFVTTVIIWFLKYFTFSFAVAQPDLSDSMLASIARFIAPIFVPLGFAVHWQVIAALITSWVAKDNFLGTLAVIYGAELVDVATMGTLFTPAAAMSFVMFFILSSPCFASIGAMRKELGTWKLTLTAIGFQMGTAWIVAFLVYQVANFIL